jgi:hypothetical protein
VIRGAARTCAQVGLLSGALLLGGIARAQDAPAEISEGMPSDPMMMLGKTPFTIQGFGNVDYVARAAEGDHSGFRNGAFEFFVSSRLSDHWTVLAELVFEPDGNTLSTDLERFELTYEMSDAFRISAGRVHNPILRWSVTNHHGLFMQTPINNPIIARWEDHNGLWPLHFVGVMASGRLPGSLGVRYWAGVGNGRGTARDEVQVGSDANGSKAYVTSVGVAPDAIPGLQAFASAYFDWIPAPGGEIRERDATLSLSYIRGAEELRAEWSLLQHTPRGGARFDTHGWYVLASHGLSAPLKGLRPYVLLEALDVADGEAFLDGIPSEKAVAVGLRFDVNRWMALKGEFRSQKVGDGPRASIVGFQLAANF